MVRSIAFNVLGVACVGMSAQTVAPSPSAQRPKFEAFEVATIKQSKPDDKNRFMLMQGTHRFVARNFTLKLLIAGAYNLNPKTVSGGPGWMDADHFDIVAITPGDVRPDREEQMAMLRGLLADRFKLTFHRERKEFSIYELDVATGGPKLRASTGAPDDPPALVSTVYPQKVVLPARNATMADFVAMMQRAMMDRPVVDKTGLTGRYDFDLEWAPDETQFGGELPRAPSDAQAAPLFTAIREQLGLEFKATRGPVDALIVDGAQRPAEN
jgi:uncharacterized protein (TIGR03435 family)